MHSDKPLEMPSASTLRKSIQVSTLILSWLIAIGIFIQISGKVWIESGSGRNTQIYIFLLLPALLITLCKIAQRKLQLSLHYSIWILFLIWVALSTLWATNSPTDPLALAKRGMYIALYLAAIHYTMRINEQLLRRAIFSGIAIIAIGALATIVYQFAVLEIPLGYRTHRLYRLDIGEFADYGWPVAAGIFHGAAAMYALYAAIEKDQRLGKSVFWGAIFLILASYVLLTYTRGAWIALFVGSIATIVLQRSRKGWLALALGALTAGILVTIFWPNLMVELHTRQLSGRGPIWQYFFEQMQGKWLLGHGLGTPFEYHWPDGHAISPHAHSLYLQQIYDSGLIALSTMSAGIVILLVKAWSLRENYWVKLALPALIYGLVAMITDVERIFTRPGDYWTVFWLPIAILLAVPSKINCPKTA